MEKWRKKTPAGKYLPVESVKIIVYGRMNGLYSSRKIEQACLRDINFMYLLGRERAPDHATIARFCSQRLTGVVQELFAQLTKLLADAGELSLEQAFIDGTKLEANANRYSFLCGKSLPKKTRPKCRKK